MAQPFRKKIALTANTPLVLLSAIQLAGYQDSPLADELKIVAGATDIYIDSSAAGISAATSYRIPALTAYEERAVNRRIDLAKVVLLSAMASEIQVSVRPI